MLYAPARLVYVLCCYFDKACRLRYCYTVTVSVGGACERYGLDIPLTLVNQGKNMRDLDRLSSTDASITWFIKLVDHLRAKNLAQRSQAAMISESTCP